MVPKGWIISSLGDLGRWSGGGTPSKAITEYWENGTIPWVSPKDMGRERISITEDYITPSAVEKSSTKLYPAGSVLVVTRSGILRKKVPVALALVPVAVNQDIKVLPSSKTISTEYVANFMWCYNESILARCAKDGTTVESIDTTSLLGFPIKLPPLTEQKKIAKILSTWDKAISTTEQLLANSQQQKKALMQQLLTGKKRLLDNNGVRFSGEWKQVKLSKIFERVTTKNNGKSSNVVTISGQQGLIRQEDFFKKSVASDILDGYFLLMKGQFAYNKSYSNGYPMGAIKRLNRYADGVVTTLYICFEISESTKANGDFWEHYFESGLLNKGLSQIAHEGGRAHGLLNVKPTDFFSLKVPLPSLDEQQKIAAVLTAADREITILQQKLAALKQEKQALMQQLLTGKRRVKIN
ncbi:hypothetical protein OPFLODJI_02593 [Aeromonas hydrophila]|uniref:restriction endonuclease subunit S n=1 Tax=Aeromonas hydrophila TaxID=644 RepID=UPI00366E3550